MDNEQEKIEKIIENMDPNSIEFGLLLKIDELIINLGNKKSLEEVVKTTIDGELTLFLTNLHSEKELFENLEQGLSLELEKDTVKSIIEEVEKFISPLKNLVEAKKEEATKAPSPAQVLANIQERLTKPTTVAPITRDYSVTRSPESSTPKVDASPRTPSMDIYREVPDK